MAHREICAIPRCPEKTFGRITDGRKRFDLCLNHFDTTHAFYGPAIEIVETWGERPATIEVDLIDSTIDKINAARGAAE